MPRVCIRKPASHIQMLALYSRMMYASPNTVVTMSSQWAARNEEGRVNSDTIFT